MTKQEYNKKWKSEHRERVKEVWLRWASENKELLKERRKKYRLANLEKRKESCRVWRAAHPDYGKKYRLENKEKCANYSKRWQKEKKEMANAKTKRWQHTPKGKIAKQKNRKKMAVKRRGFGFVLLNKQTLGTEGHHIDRDRIIYIPFDMHEINPHSVTNDKGMDLINYLAFSYLEAEEMYANWTSCVEPIGITPLDNQQNTQKEIWKWKI